MAVELIEARRICDDCENSLLGSEGVYCQVFQELIGHADEAERCTSFVSIGGRRGRRNT